MAPPTHHASNPARSSRCAMSSTLLVGRRRFMVRRRVGMRKHLSPYSMDLTSRPAMPDLLPYLDAAAAHPEFKREVLEYIAGASPARIELEGRAPRVKVARVLTQLFHAHPTLPVERVRLSATSGCSDFSGELVAVAGDVEHRFRFTWCCAWKAEQNGWKDCFGFWDQERAAREFGWRCFQRWEAIGS
jgi:hypothetical protein